MEILIHKMMSYICMWCNFYTFITGELCRTNFIKSQYYTNYTNYMDKLIDLCNSERLKYAKC